jgi:hypothetical protein
MVEQNILRLLCGYATKSMNRIATNVTVSIGKNGVQRFDRASGIATDPS